MPSYVIHFWRKTPFLRLLLFMLPGIFLQWHLQLSVTIWLITAACAIIISCSFYFLSLFKQYKLSIITGFAVALLFTALGALLVWHKDVRNNKHWLGHLYKPDETLIVSLDQPLVEKTKSFKANASVLSIIKENATTPVTGKIIIYFKKDSALNDLNYGSQVIFKKPLQEIKNSGNPGAFDYKRYSLFQGITHQVYLQPGDFGILHDKKEKWLPSFINTCRAWVLNVLRNNIKAEKELGLAEALLIGYKDDLDQALVQSYTNTGVIHVIAISGLHLGIIYLFLVWLSKPLQSQKRFRLLRPLIIITGLWLFSLLAGAQPSVLRSAVMFSCIVLGESLDRRTSIYNTLAASAFLLLCYDPYWLWDVGFQLSYSAVLSIVIFMRPIYNLLYFKNTFADLIWKLNAVTLAAQLLTLPISIYHFHQFPSYFFLTNFFAVPLSSIILIGEIILCIVSFIPAVAIFIGKILSWLIWLMNTYVERVEAIPFSLQDGWQINILQCILLFVLVAGFSYWLMEKINTGLKWGLAAIFCFGILRSYSFLQTLQQQKIIVYNVPQKQAIDFISGQQYFFKGDSSLLTDDFVRNFHLKPSRIKHRVAPADSLKVLNRQGNYINYHNKRIVIADGSSILYDHTEKRTVIDLLIISNNPRLYISKLSNTLDIKQIVFDASTTQWKLNYWKKDCDSLGIPYYEVAAKGAFVMTLR